MRVLHAFCWTALLPEHLGLCHQGVTAAQEMCPKAWFQRIDPPGIYIPETFSNMN